SRQPTAGIRKLRIPRKVLLPVGSRNTRHSCRRPAARFPKGQNQRSRQIPRCLRRFSSSAREANSHRRLRKAGRKEIALKRERETQDRRKVEREPTRSAESNHHRGSSNLLQCGRKPASGRKTSGLRRSAIHRDRASWRPLAIVTPADITSIRSNNRGNSCRLHIRQAR